ncbi:MAG: glycosyltransferase family 39 protein [Chloroflexi bacterium]|nr:glycosyltransferase family 39 protein [Chloroflexota bacterium]
MQLTVGLSIPIRLATGLRLSAAGAVAATMGLALFLRLVHLGDLSFWSDEIISITRSQAAWSFQLHMFTYENILRLWMGLGESEAAVRMLSVLFGVAAVPAMYALAARLFGVRAGLIASLLLAVNAFHVQYSQEARSYSLLVLLVILSTLLFVRGIESRSTRVWAGYVLLGVLAVYSHSFGIFVLAAHAGSVPFLRRREVPWGHLAVSWAVIVAALTPFWLSIGSGLIGGPRDIGGLSWIPETSAKQLYSVLTTLAGGGGTPLLALSLVLVSGGLIVAATTWYSSRASWDTWKYVLPLSGLFVPIFLALLISTVQPMMIPRYFIVCLPALILVASSVIAHPRLLINRISAVAPVAIAAALVATSALATVSYYSNFQKEDWRGVANHVASRWQAGDGMLFYVPWMQSKFDFYSERIAGEREFQAIVNQSQWKKFILGDEPDREAIAEYLPDGPQRVWLVLGHTNDAQRQLARREIQAALSGEYPVTESPKFSKLTLTLYSR